MVDTRLLMEIGVKSELLEWFDEVWYERFSKEVAPRIKVRLFSKPTES